MLENGVTQDLCSGLSVQSLGSNTVACGSAVTSSSCLSSNFSSLDRQGYYSGEAARDVTGKHTFSGVGLCADTVSLPWVSMSFICFFCIKPICKIIQLYKWYALFYFLSASTGFWGLRCTPLITFKVFFCNVATVKSMYCLFEHSIINCAHV